MRTFPGPAFKRKSADLRVSILMNDPLSQFRWVVKLVSISKVLAKYDRHNSTICSLYLSKRTTFSSSAKISLNHLKLCKTLK